MSLSNFCLVAKSLMRLLAAYVDPSAPKDRSLFNMYACVMLLHIYNTYLMFIV